MNETGRLCLLNVATQVCRSLNETGRLCLLNVATQVCRMKQVDYVYLMLPLRYVGV